MSVCQTDAFSLTVPDSWVDRSMITWVAPPAQAWKVLPNLLCSKGEMLAGESLGTFVNRQLKELMNQVKNFDLISRQDTLFGGVPAVEIVFSIKPQNIMLKQKQIFFIPDQSKSIAHTVVFTAAKEDYAKLEGAFSQISNSISWNA